MTAEPPDPSGIARHLRAHPGFLAERPDLYAVLHPPARVHGEVLADHMAAMVRAGRAEASALRERADAVLAACRAAAGVAERVQEAVLALLGAPDLADCVAETLPGLLGVDAAALCCESEAVSRWRILPPGTVRALLRDRPAAFRDRPADAPLFHAEAAPLAERDALIAVPGGDAPALLALASRDPSALPAAAGWAFLGRVVGALAACRPAASGQAPMPVRLVRG